ncbi:hypothetical protein [Parasitella parasitica]|uniref:Probable valine--tRNA ligase, cytoplasmic n=1 Tax=Parasitella parasitica TaxID=35722 RepID=A0A0B7NN70_9FUNG|nr:hypothetical protein [Parasitella parasitica]
MFCTSVSSIPHMSAADTKEQKEAPVAAAAAATAAVELDPAAAAKKAKNEKKNEEKRLAKMAKFAAKQAKLDEAKKNATAPNAEKKKKKEPKPPAPVFVNKTPKGDKKDMSEPFASAYDPRAVESAWYDWWVKEGFFKPEFGPDGKPKPEGTFVIPAPPPNVTGSLHIGHALTVALQDALIRWNRMLGKTVLFQPGTDHAGISCQSVVEKMLLKEQGITRHDLGREKFVEQVFAWKEKYGNTIHTQFERLGASFDWDRAKFTMDPASIYANGPSAAVRENFIRLHRDGIIYRANRLVNWCVQLNTTLSNLEVDNKEIEAHTLMSVVGYDKNERFEFGVLNEFAYQVEGSVERLVVATTRIETMLGDTAIAVHPNDERYKHLHGKYVVHPFLDRRIPIVTDDIAVDMEFGTGAVKITPAHDFNDYEVGKRHNLEFINLLNDNGTYNENAGPYQGMKRFHVRNKIIEDLKEKGLFVGVKENPMTVPVCSKSGDIIEPVMKPQWWVKCQGMADKAMQAVKDGELKIAPDFCNGLWFSWLKNINDWCISRQLWWGHRIPAYFVKIEGEEHDSMNEDMWVVAADEEEAYAQAKSKFPGKKLSLEQDPDVLDTWFSSGLWPFSTQGWPEKTFDMEHFYPASMLETGWDIIFFWVARMVMLGIQLTGKVPFAEVYCHALIRDAHGRKMSKSLGNVIDPIDVIEGITLQGLHDKLSQSNLDPKETKKATAGQKADFPNGIPQCGTDALRFALCNFSTGSTDIDLEILRIEGYRRFCNKLWNATRFALMKLGDDFVPSKSADPSGNESLADKWILSRLNKCAIDTNTALEQRNFMMATNNVYQFWLYDLCDVYIETVKPICDADTAGDEAATVRKITAQNTLYTCLEAGLKLLHPFMPYVTEELFQRLGRRPGRDERSIVLARYPVENEAYNKYEQAEKDFNTVIEIVKSIRSLASDLDKKKDLVAYIQTDDSDLKSLYEDNKGSIAALVKGLVELTVSDASAGAPADCGTAACGKNVTLFIRNRQEMAQPVAQKLLVVGGSGFLGLSICKIAANKGWETVSLSRRGEPTAFSEYGKPEWAQKVQWASGNSLEPDTYRDVLKDVTAVVHSVGILMENDYKSVAQAQSLCEAASGIPRMILGMKDHGNPLDPKLKNNPRPTYEMMNRDTAKTIADEVSKLPSISSFVYISASDVFPFIDPRYITTKREAERYLFQSKEFKTVVLRPGFMYSVSRPTAIPIAGALQFANAVASPFKDAIASLPGGKIITTPALQTEQVARAVIAGIESRQAGIFDVQGIEELSRTPI